MSDILDISDWLTVVRIAPHTQTVIPFIMVCRSPKDPSNEDENAMELFPCWLEPFLQPDWDDDRARQAIRVLAAHQPRQTFPEQTLNDWMGLPAFMPFKSDSTYGRMAVAERFPGGRLAIAKRLGITFWTILPPPATP